MTTMHDLTIRGFGTSSGEPCCGSLVTSGGYIKIHNELIPIHGITYEVPHKEAEVREMIIRADGKATLLTKSLDGTVDRVIRDTDLKRVAFSADGEVTLKPKGT